LGRADSQAEGGGKKNLIVFGRIPHKKLQLLEINEILLGKRTSNLKPSSEKCYKDCSQLARKTVKESITGGTCRKKEKGGMAYFTFKVKIVGDDYPTYLER